MTVQLVLESKMAITDAFRSLSFRENRCYSPPCSLFKTTKTAKVRTGRKAKTYGGILCLTTASMTEYALVQGRYTGKWSFPKGHMNEGEEPLACCLREIEEETGITELPLPTECNQIGYGNYFMFSLTRKIELVPRDRKEIMNARWVTLEEMSKLELNADVSMWFNAVTNPQIAELQTRDLQTGDLQTRDLQTRDLTKTCEG